jgi:hypothetical protein
MRKKGGGRRQGQTNRQNRQNIRGGKRKEVGREGRKEEKNEGGRRKERVIFSRVFSFSS